MLSAESFSAKVAYTVVAVGLLSTILGLALFCVESVLSKDEANAFHVWFQFICGSNWPSGWDGVMDPKASYFAAALVVKLFLAFGPIYGIIVIIGKLIIIERGQRMTVMDILRLRDSMIKIQLLGKFPPAERGRMELQFNDALAQASQRWAEQHLTTLFGQRRAKEILDQLNRDQIG